MQRLGKIRYLIDQLKLSTLSEYLLFNQPDGLLIASTFGKLELEPLKFMKFEIGTLDSNIYNIYQQVMGLQNITNFSPLSLSTIVYESDNCFILVKEVSNGATIMAVTKNKKPEVFASTMNALSNKDFDNLKEYLKNSNY